MNKRKGISLIVLVITILVMIILAGVVIVSLSKNNPVNKAKEATFKTDVSTFEGDLSFYLANSLATDSTLRMEDVDASGYSEIKKVINSFAEKYADKFEVVDGKLVYIGEDKDELVWIGELGISTKAGIVNAPVLSSGMIPIKYNGTKWVICDSKDPEWYNYESKKWANVMLSDGKYKTITPGTVVEDADLGSMFVWIPRYAYSINKYKTAASGSEGQTQEIHDISFLLGTSDSDVDGKTYPKTYDAKNAEVGKPTPKIVHPTFNFDGKELKGIWFAKFEASMDESTGHSNENNKESCNFVDAKGCIKILPSKLTWRNIQLGNIFLNCKNMIVSDNSYGLTNVDSHLMKNAEWGAVAYLTTSKYGITPTINKLSSTTPNGEYMTWTGGNKYREFISQSTTGNTTGIYDMNGGSWEYTASFFNNKSSNLQTFATQLFKDFNLKPEYNKYFDIYDVSEEEKNNMLHDSIWQSPHNDITYGNKFRINITDKKYDLMAKKYGDAMFEAVNKKEYSYFGKLTNNDYSWIKGKEEASETIFGETFYNNDFMLLGNIHIPYIIRGGDCGNAFHAGIFASNNVGGDPHVFTSFRPVLVNI